MVILLRFAVFAARPVVDAVIDRSFSVDDDVRAVVYDIVNQAIDFREAAVAAAQEILYDALASELGALSVLDFETQRMLVSPLLKKVPAAVPDVRLALLAHTCPIVQ